MTLHVDCKSSSSSQRSTTAQSSSDPSPQPSCTAYFRPPAAAVSASSSEKSISRLFLARSWSTLGSPETRKATDGARPRQAFQWKSTSAIPTLSTTPARSGSTTPSGGFGSSTNMDTAADLLKQAMMQRAAAGDDDHDHIGSNGSTPPGASTPRPDLTDKRLPGILHSYFGQVRDSFRTRPKSASHPAQATETAASDEMEAGERRDPPLGPTVGSIAPPTAPSSPVEGPAGEDHSPALLPHERLEPPPPPNASHRDPALSYPTPPTSSASSMHRSSDNDHGTRASGRPAARAASAHDGPGSSEGSKPPTRRHTFTTASPLSGIVTTSAVLAPHMANPAASPASNTPAHSLVTPLSASRPSSASQPSGDVKKLTEGMNAPPHDQNTPPQTPRTRSQEGKPPSAQSRASSNGQPGGDGSGPVRPPKGKLSVAITEGRGLRPSVDPYVVCQFQWSEYISEGPKGEQRGKAIGNGARRAPGGGVVAIKRTDSDMGRPMAIPMRSRQSSHTGHDAREAREQVTNPKWEHEAIFDVVGDHSELDISVYDRMKAEAFLGHVRFCPNLVEYEMPYDGWFTLEPREGEEDHVTGEVHLRINFQKVEKRHYGPEDFEILKLIGKGTFGQVFQVRKKDTKRIYAMKVLSKKVIVQKKEVAHTLGERNILVRTATSDSPFIVGLKFSFQTPTDLYLVTDYMSGGELFWHLQREGRFHEQRAKFYIAELILALQHLHDHNIVYRDLKPENILLDANGHIALCDFGLSKANLAQNDTTNTFCGTTEYLAPEVLLDEHGYTKMVDFWSLGVLVFEMCCGWSPFYAEDTQQMYKNIAFGKVRFPRDALSTEGRNFVKGLLNRNPKHRLGAQRDAGELKEHPFFADIDWDALAKKNVVPPFKPKLKSELDVSNFDPEFTNALNGAGSLNARAAALASGYNPASTPLSPTVQANFKGFTFVDESALEQNFRDLRTSDMERMDEDYRDEDLDWERPYDRADRMSGVIPSNDQDDSFFHGNFD